jgi:hypothetical protein
MTGDWTLSERLAALAGSRPVFARAGEQAAQLNGCQQISAPLISRADRSSIDLRDHEHLRSMSCRGDGKQEAYTGLRGGNGVAISLAPNGPKSYPPIWG